MELGRSSLPLLGQAGGRSLQTCRWKCAYDCFHDKPNRSGNEPFTSVVERGLTRRGFLKGAGAALVLTAATPLVGGSAAAQTGRNGRGPGFEPIAPSMVDDVIVPDGYEYGVLLRWGDPVLPDAPAWDFNNQSPEAQAGQFGYNCDFVAFMPLPSRSSNSGRGLVWVNHEYTNPEVMFPGYSSDSPTAAQVDIERMAHGGSIVTVKRDRRTGHMQFVQDGGWNRRIHAETPMELTGPAAGDALLRTSVDPTGTQVAGMLNNCAGGVTPWGTILTCEENFHQYFANRAAVSDDRVADLHARVGIPEGASERKWELFHSRYDVAQEPNEPFRFGWTVEIDPYDPTFTPRKRTALGRYKHEGATTRLTADKRVAVYSGDDEVFEYIYKFVTVGRYRRNDRAHNLGLLDEGTLYVARFDIDEDGNGVGEWLPLVFGEGPLTPENGFASQADVVIDARRAGDLVGATPMDRPEDVEPSPLTGAVYAALTNNTSRTEPNAANPRSPNRGGHVIEWNEDGNDAAATTFTWRFLLICGDPDDPTTYFAGFPKELVSPISSPDNLLFDRRYNLWIATDGQPTFLGHNDAFHVVPLSGDSRGHVQQFLSVPVGAEACGPELTPDEQTLFCAVQHPGEGSTAASPSSTWPDRRSPPRPSLVTVVKADPRGGVRIGT
ncbi:MAG TPA: PhoX family phosphatase [Euzebyales bacterium]